MYPFYKELSNLIKIFKYRARARVFQSLYCLIYCGFYCGLVELVALSFDPDAYNLFSLLTGLLLYHCM